MKKTVVIIGAGPGLGQGIARRFGKEKYFVILIARNQENLVKLSEELNALNIDNTFALADTANEKEFAMVIEGLKTEFGTPDVVIYNVGITTPGTDNLSTEELVHHYKTDVAGAYTAIKGFADEKFSEKKGSIILTGGGLALYPADGFIPLSIDKAALRALAYIFHNKLKGKGIFVGTVTVCGTINGNDYFSVDNIAEMYWQINEKRDRCEYTYQFPELTPEKLYDGKPVTYGIFEDNTANYWGEVYKLMQNS